MKYIKIWLTLSLAAAGIWGLIWLTTGQPDAAAVTTDCESITDSVSHLIPATAGQAISWDRLTVKSQNDWVTISNLVVNNAQCFKPETVARMQTLQQNLHH
jgi:ribonuclease HI